MDIHFLFLLRTACQPDVLSPERERSFPGNLPGGADCRLMSYLSYGIIFHLVLTLESRFCKHDNLFGSELELYRYQAIKKMQRLLHFLLFIFILFYYRRNVIGHAQKFSCVSTSVPHTE